VIGYYGDAEIELIDVFDRNARLGPAPPGEHELVELKLDVACVIATLPPELSDLAEALKTESVSEIAETTDIPRTTLSSRKKKILQRFEEAGLRKYLNPSSSSCGLSA